VKNPRKTVPRAILIAISGALIIYLLLQLVSQGVLGEELTSYKEGPLAEAAGRVFGPAGFLALTFAAAISMFGNLSSEILSMPRLLYSAARDNVLPPKKLSVIHPVFRTPYVAIIFYAAAGCLLACVGGFEVLAVISSAYVILLYLGVALSIFRLRKSENSQADIFVIPGGPLVPLAAIAVMLVLLAGLKQDEVFGGAISIVVLTAIYFITNRLRK
jgi:amino acid transporter